MLCVGRCSQALHGTHADRARWRVCVSYVNDNFGMAVGRMFVKDNFDIKAKINVSDRMRQAFVVINICVTTCHGMSYKCHGMSPRVCWVSSN